MPIHPARRCSSLTELGSAPSSRLARPAEDLTYPEVYEALQSAERVLARSVNPTVMSPAQWRDKRTRRDSFVARIAEQPKLFVLGSEDAFA